MEQENASLDDRRLAEQSTTTGDQHQPLKDTLLAGLMLDETRNRRSALEPQSLFPLFLLASAKAWVWEERRYPEPVKVDRCSYTVRQQTLVLLHKAKQAPGPACCERSILQSGRNGWGTREQGRPTTTMHF